MPGLSMNVLDTLPGREPKAPPPETRDTIEPGFFDDDENLDEEKKLAKRVYLDLAEDLGPSSSKTSRMETHKFVMQLPMEILQVIAQLNCPKPGNNGKLMRPAKMRIEKETLVLPDYPPLQQCQQMQQIQSLIHFHEQQVKYRSYMQMETLRFIRKQLQNQMMLHPTMEHYKALVDMAANNQLTPLSQAEKAQIMFYTAMADWTLEARGLLIEKETPLYLYLFGRQVSDLKNRINEITTHEQFQVFAPQYAERIDHHRELIHVLNRRTMATI